MLRLHCYMRSKIQRNETNAQRGRGRAIADLIYDEGIAVSRLHVAKKDPLGTIGLDVFRSTQTTSLAVGVRFLRCSALVTRSGASERKSIPPSIDAAIVALGATDAVENTRVMPQQ